MVNQQYTIKHIFCQFDVDIGQGATVELEFELVVDARTPQHIDETVREQIQCLAEELLTKYVARHNRAQLMRESKTVLARLLVGPIGQTECWRQLPEGVLVSRVEFKRCVINDGSTMIVSAGTGITL